MSSKESSKEEQAMAPRSTGLAPFEMDRWFEEIREHWGDNLRSTWHSVAEGWRQLWHRAGRALTRFKPGREPQWLVAEGWRQLLRRAGRAPTRFTPDREPQVPAAGAEWGFVVADAYDEEDRIVIKIEAPELEKQDFNLSVMGDALLVRGAKRFERAIPLWAEVDLKRAKASYKNGVLRVDLPKTRAQRPPITVKVRYVLSTTTPPPFRTQQPPITIEVRWAQPSSVRRDQNEPLGGREERPR